MIEYDAGMNQITLGIIADTHVPDRRRKLHAGVLGIFKAAKVARILHAGDISVPSVLRQLEDLAPVDAVRGNRDWFGFNNLPLSRVITIGGKRIGLTHGHSGLRRYLRDKIRYFIRGPRSFSYFMKRAVDALPRDVDAVIFGHNHAPMLKQLDGKLIFNPGSACCQVIPDTLPSVGLLQLINGEMRAEIVYLD